MEEQDILDAIEILDGRLRENGSTLGTHSAKGSALHKWQGAIRYLEGLLRDHQGNPSRPGVTLVRYRSGCAAQALGGLNHCLTTTMVPQLHNLRPPPSPRSPMSTLT